jgi:hypothetical protein
MYKFSVLAADRIGLARGALPEKRRTAPAYERIAIEHIAHAQNGK